MTKLLAGQIRLGEKLKEKCPQNDCIIYKNIYEHYENLVNDCEKFKGELSACSVSAIEEAMLKDRKELLDMYCDNYAIQQFKKMNHAKNGESEYITTH